MKTISEELSARLAGDCLTLCSCWRLVRKDGYTLRVTDHDQSILVDEEVFEPGASLSGGVFSMTSDLRPGQATASGALSLDAVAENDLKAGLWNGAQIDIYKVDWARADLGSIHIWSGFFGDITINAAGRFEAELLSLKVLFEKPVGRVLTKRCLARFGDERCGLAPLSGQTCDKAFQTCRDTYNNQDNFRGFPHLPGADFILEGPALDGNDGGKR